MFLQNADVVIIALDGGAAATATAMAIDAYGQEKCDAFLQRQQPATARSQLGLRLSFEHPVAVQLLEDTR